MTHHSVRDAEVFGQSDIEMTCWTSKQQLVTLTRLQSDISEFWKNLHQVIIHEYVPVHFCAVDKLLVLHGASFVSMLLCCCFQVENKHLLHNRHSLVELALLTSAHNEVLTRVSSLFSLPVVMLWAITLWPPVNPACFPVTTAISGCLTVTPCRL